MSGFKPTYLVCFVLLNFSIARAERFMTSSLAFDSVIGPSLAQRALGGVVLIEPMEGLKPGRCSGNVVSGEGHILTARHCFQKCMLRSNLFRAVEEQDAVEYFVLDPSQLGKIKCPVAINGIEQEVTIEATSPGIIIKMTETSFRIINLKLFEKLVEEGYTSKGDFVIVKPQTNSAKQCFNMAGQFKSDPKVGDKVWTAGFPGATEREDGFDSDGINIFFSHGRIIAGIESNSCLAVVNPEHPRLAEIKDTFNQPTALISSVDSVEGASGSGLFDLRGNILGILTNVFSLHWFTKADYDIPERRYCDGSSKALRIEQIWSLIDKVRPELAKKLNCLTESASQ